MMAIDPAPTVTRSALIPTWLAMAARRAAARWSRYRLADSISLATASATAGTGGYGFSLPASLMASVRPWSRLAWLADRPGR